MKRLGILCSAVVLTGSLSLAATTNVFVDFEGCTPGVIVGDADLNAGTVGGSWSSTTWGGGNTCAVITNAAGTNKAFEFAPEDNTTYHIVNLIPDSAIDLSSNPVSLSYDLAVKPYTTPTKTKALTVNAYDSSDNVVFGLKIPLVNATTDPKWMSLSWVTDADGLTADTITGSNVVQLATAGLWDDGVAVNVRLDIGASSAALYVDDNLLASSLGYVTNTAEIARIEISSKKQGIQLDNVLIETISATSHGTPIAWLQALGYTDDFEAADLADLEGDNLLNWQEYQIGTNPELFSTDGDQFSDGVEVESGADPLVDDSVVYAAILGSSHTFGVYSSNNVMDVTYGVASLSTSNDVLLIDLPMLGSEDLEGTGWSVLGDTVEFQSTTTHSAQTFYRFDTTP